ncbi:MAG: MATE family efflux transporter, partial [Armatimonadota bacterium]
QGVATVTGLGIQAMLLRTGAGPAVSAAYGVGFLIESLAILPGNAYSGAAAAFVSQNLGAGNPQRARHAARTSALQAAAAMCGAAALFAIAAPEIARIFFPKSDPVSIAAHALVVDYLRTVCWVEPFAAIGIVLSGALNGAGETRIPRTITFATMGVRLALVYLALQAWGFGARGAWAALAATPVLGAVLTWTAWRKGGWMTKSV